MRYAKILLLPILFLTFTFSADAQLRSRKTATSSPPPLSREIRSTPAYAEILLRQVTLQADLADLLVRYTNEFPKVQEITLELSMLDKTMARLSKVPNTETQKLTIALGKMLLREAAYATELELLKKKYSEEHPEVKRMDKKLQIFQNAVDEIM